MSFLHFYIIFLINEKMDLYFRHFFPSVMADCTRRINWKIIFFYLGILVGENSINDNKKKQETLAVLC